MAREAVLCTCDRRPGGLRSGVEVMENRRLMLCLKLNSRFLLRLACSQVTIPTKLSQLPSVKEAFKSRLKLWSNIIL
jgi:hypothetical protein